MLQVYDSQSFNRPNATVQCTLFDTDREWKTNSEIYLLEMVSKIFSATETFGTRIPQGILEMETR